MKYASFLLLIMLLSCQTNDQELAKVYGPDVLSKSIAFHDPEGIWANSTLDMKIQEPRVQNPRRYSNVQLNNSNGAFSLERDRDERTTRHMIDGAGNAQTLLDGALEEDPELISQYRLQPERNANYRAYYQFMYGAPMVLTEDYGRIVAAGRETLDDEVALYIDFELTEEMIAKVWRLYFSPEDYQLVGLKTMHEDPNEGEYLIFNGLAEIGGMKTPRFRHWHRIKDRNYSGSDIVVTAQLKTE